MEEPLRVRQGGRVVTLNEKTMVTPRINTSVCEYRYTHICTCTYISVTCLWDVSRKRDRHHSPIPTPFRLCPRLSQIQKPWRGSVRRKVLHTDYCPVVRPTWEDLIPSPLLKWDVHLLKYEKGVMGRRKGRRSTQSLNREVSGNEWRGTEGSRMKTRVRDTRD